MIWAKPQKKRFFQRPRMAMMTIYTIGLCMLSLAAFAQTAPIAADYRITLAEAEQQIAQELMRSGHGDDIQANVIGRRSQDLVRRNHPVVMEVVDVQTQNNNRFSATLLFTTEADLNRPAQKLGNIVLSGRFDEMVDVPVVKFRLSSADIIREQDMEWLKLPQNRIKRETITEMAQLIGKSPVRGLSPNRAIESDEVQSPPLVTRRMPVRMRYNTENISIQAVGTAMQDGAMGERIKVRNDDSGVEVDATVVDRGHVEVLPALAFNNG
ncbi:MAG: flagellar basal body P-ring formation chaperone FlgA [Alphaproteobacteria bacterium]|nr:flagellar basal body P-ring formation chaperone FlgA [Alphaproteobacteria bacterium]